MTNQAKHAQPAKGTPPTGGSAPDYGFLLEANQLAFARWLNGVNALSQEIAQFTQGRLQEDMAAWSTLASCSSPEAAFECQQRLAEKATAGRGRSLIAGLRHPRQASRPRGAPVAFAQNIKRV
jgi:phasin protein